MSNERIESRLQEISCKIQGLLKTKHQYEKLKLLAEIKEAISRFEQKTDSVRIEVKFQCWDVLELLNDTQRHHLFEVLKEMLEYQRKDLEDELNGNGNEDC